MEPYPDLSSRSPLPPFLVPSIILITAATLTLPRSNTVSVTALLLILAILSQLPRYTVGAADYVNGCQAGIALLRFLALSFCRDPRKECWRVDEIGAGNEQTEDPEKLWKKKSTYQRWKWALPLVLSVREIGYSSQAKNIPTTVPRGYPIWKYCTIQAFKALWYFLLYDICETSVQHIVRAGFSTILSQAPERQLYLAWLAAFKEYFQIAMQYFAASSLTTALRIYDPQDWPPMFGQWKDAYTVRNFWGRTYHQMMRTSLTVPSKYITTHILHLPKNSLITKYTQLYLVFFLSATFHYMGGLFAARQELGEYKFFMFQAAVITFEDFVGWLFAGNSSSSAKSKEPNGGKEGESGVPPWRRVLGWFWVMACMSYSLRGWVDGRVRGGEWSGRQMPISIVEKLWPVK
ncbi:hypothetical protein BP6252_04696 [Coleophoma cylindrospora]|uniref:Wax synthase domain-containing protein n=1 Tax=Coleophoma cylindrospora TaxID=1849047 RepID=A0A3D8S1B8_9HELO|nr:hypothetical protein BP6252_04696 [Coleophoma cylindrospora]